MASLVRSAHTEVPVTPILAALAVLLSPLPSHPAPPPSGPDDPLAAFEAWTGARLVFTRAQTPDEVLYATTPELSDARKRRAAELLYAHALHYPRETFARIGLRTVAVFAGCGDPEGDGFRPWVEALEGYRYFGRWHERGAIAACYYDDVQLPLTFHHEVFHHVDATVAGRTRYRYFTDDDDAFAEAVAGRARRPGLTLDRATLDALAEVTTGEILEEAVGQYAQKSAGEDQAETARWLQTHLADGLVQAALRPELAGSQRILHLLSEYEKAWPTMTVSWFVTVALRSEGQAQRKAPEPRDTTPRARGDNTYLAKVDAEISDPGLRRAIRRVQPATVRLGGGSGVNLAPGGLILTAGHVADRVGERFTVSFPDGRDFTGVTLVTDPHLDLALVELEGAADLPFARLSERAPEVGDPVVVIGQPGRRTPQGEPTHYEPWHVSVGRIRGFLPDLLGAQSLGRTKHSAWTYWGHSGSPLFGADGRIVALHNSWDSRTAMRHAVPWEAIRQFLAGR